jgi:hypothetical protein
MYRHEDDPSLWVAATDSRSGVDPVEDRQGNIRNNHIGRELYCSAHEHTVAG